MSAPRPLDPGRRSIRLKDWNYTSAAAYFVTLVACQRVSLFGQIATGETCLTEAGKIARDEWFQTARLRSNVRLYQDEFVIMPNHIYGILWIVEDAQDVAVVGAQRRCAPATGKIITLGGKNTNRCTPTGEIPVGNHRPIVMAGSLGAILRAYKSAVTRRVNALGGGSASLWQRNYYEHIIRSQRELDSIRDYILNNPARWDVDTENSENLKTRS